MVLFIFVRRCLNRTQTRPMTDPKEPPQDNPRVPRIILEKNGRLFIFPGEVKHILRNTKFDHNIQMPNRALFELERHKEASQEGN